MIVIVKGLIKELEDVILYREDIYDNMINGTVSGYSSRYRRNSYYESTLSIINLLSYLKKLNIEEVSDSSDLLSPFGLFCNGNTLYYSKSSLLFSDLKENLLIELMLSRHNRTLRLTEAQKFIIQKNVLHSLSMMFLIPDLPKNVSIVGIGPLLEFLINRGLYFYSTMTVSSIDSSNNVLLSDQHKSDRIIYRALKTKNIVGVTIIDILNEYKPNLAKYSNCDISVLNKELGRSSRVVDEYLLRDSMCLVNRRNKEEREMYKKHCSQVELLNNLK